MIPAPTNPSVLIVDDESAVRALLCERLTPAEFDCRNCASGERGWKSEAFDAIISDLNMPGISGLELLENARKKHPHSAFLIVHEAGAARHGRTGGIVPPVISAVLRGTSTPHVPPTSPPAALLSIAHYGDTISCSGAVSSAGNARGDTGATAEAVTVICSCQ